MAKTRTRHTDVTGHTIGRLPLGEAVRLLYEEEGVRLVGPFGDTTSAFVTVDGNGQRAVAVPEAGLVLAGDELNTQVVVLAEEG